MAIKMVFYQSTPYGEIRKFVCSLDSDRSNLPISTSSTNRCDATSEAFIEETGKTYYLSSSDTWLEKKNLILPAGTNVIGKVSIDQTTDETTNLVRIKGIALTNYAAMTAAASGIIKASAGVLHSLTVTNNRTSAQYFQLHNSATLPADTAVPVYSIYLQSGAIAEISFGVYGKSFTNGIVWCNSSTQATKTIGSADLTVSAEYK